MTDTFIQQLPNIDNNVYYTSDYKPFETQIKTLNINNYITTTTSNNNNNKLLSNNEYCFYGFDSYDIESVYDSFNNNNNSITQTSTNTLESDENINNNLFYDISGNTTLESSLSNDTHFKISPSFIQNSFSKKSQSHSQQVVEPTLNPLESHRPEQFTILTPKPLHLNDLYCPLLYTENLTYEQYLRSNECINRPNCSNKRKDKKRDKKKHKRKCINILSSFSDYSSIFPPIEGKLSKCEKKLTVKKPNNLQNTISTHHKLPSEQNNYSLAYPPLDSDFVTIIGNNLNRYTTNLIDETTCSDSNNKPKYGNNTNQDILDKIRLQEVSYRFSKSYF